MCITTAKAVHPVYTCKEPSRALVALLFTQGSTTICLRCINSRCASRFCMVRFVAHVTRGGFPPTACLFFFLFAPARNLNPVHAVWLQLTPCYCRGLENGGGDNLCCVNAGLQLMRHNKGIREALVSFSAGSSQGGKTADRSVC